MHCVCACNRFTEKVVKQNSKNPQKFSEKL